MTGWDLNIVRMLWYGWKLETVAITELNTSFDPQPKPTHHLVSHRVERFCTHLKLVGALRRSWHRIQEGPSNTLEWHESGRVAEVVGLSHQNRYSQSSHSLMPWDVYQNETYIIDCSSCLLQHVEGTTPNFVGQRLIATESTSITYSSNVWV